VTKMADRYISSIETVSLYIKLVECPARCYGFSRELRKTNIVEVVYDTSPETTTRVARGGLLIGGIKSLNTQAG
jgi:hypothetical protein